ncbi:GPI mannosyltransferase-like protein [Emericellopsis cladophorae]|uniref:Mannosyltransferase n=1 Tax=Emericellopsis cladophorae TaxID=2686198 RepID=A0A9P9XW69_9HYPO|nr:GPI mannosyltransferase-like protein [Emericellopsis cladophorae]KAI6778816.1 GPI mannosyltransferase-like protein [Emericellopsis cladophorae]
MSVTSIKKSFVFLRAIIIIRLINAFWVTTFFQPDEYFQALEPAWELAFGARSGAWLTWEWRHQLRSSLHPVVFSAAYLVADHGTRYLPIGSTAKTAVIVAAPRFVQAIIAALGDFFTWKLAMKIYPNSNDSSFALFLQLFSAWQWYCSIRTFSNSLETTLTITALYYFPWRDLLGVARTIKENPKMANSIHQRPGALRLSIICAAFAVLLRPTNMLIWLAIILVSFTRLCLKGPSPLSQAKVIVLFREAILCGTVALGVSLISDRLYFGFWTFPPYNWLYFNISKSLAVFYGRNPWHYYILQGIPLLSTTSLPFVLMALYKPSTSTEEQYNILRTMTLAVGITITALSLISHKEVRFIYPLLPIFNILAAPLAARFFTIPPPTTSQPPRLKKKMWLYLAVGINVLVAGYLSLIHQRAPLEMVSHLRKSYQDFPAAQKDDLYVLFLMPCHSTPWRSHLAHDSMNAYALTCEPPLHTAPNTPERELYRDEADRFYDDPIKFLSTELFAGEGRSPVPSYIAGFEGIEPWLHEFFESTSTGRNLGVTVKPVWSAFNGFFNEDWRRAGRMVIWETVPVERHTDL